MLDILFCCKLKYQTLSRYSGASHSLVISLLLMTNQLAYGDIDGGRCWGDEDEQLEMFVSHSWLK